MYKPVSNEHQFLIAKFYLLVFQFVFVPDATICYFFQLSLLNVELIFEFLAHHKPVIQLEPKR